MTKDPWPQYKKYLQNLPLNGLYNIRNRLKYQVKNEERILRKRGTFDQRKKELDFINEEILRRNEAKN